MIIKQKTHKGIKFLVREGTSDEKTFNEVIVNNTYQKKDIMDKIYEYADYYYNKYKV